MTPFFSSSTPNAAPLRLLLVDDDDFDRATVRRALREAKVPAEYTEAADAGSALAQARQSRFDCVLLDYHLPGHDGLWVLRELLSSGLDAPVVMLTGQGGEHVAVELMKAGASDYLAKAGLTGERLSRAVWHAVLLHRSRKEALEAADALRRSESRFRTLVAASSQFVWIADAEGRPAPESHGWFSFTGQTPASAALGWLDAVHPDEQAEVQRNWQEAVTARRRFEAEMRLRREDGKYVWVQSSGVPHLGPDGSVMEWIGTVTDISEKKLREEEERKRAEFEQQLVGIVSHDLRNPISAIIMSASMLLARSGLDGHTMRGLGRIRSSGERTLRMICDLLDFTQARLGGALPIHPKPADLHDLAHQAVEEALAATPERQIHHTHEGDGTGYWDPDRLSQLLSNLLGNALAYSPSDTPVHVRTGGDGTYVTVEVNNQGEPIPPDILPALFEPFKRGVRKEARTGRSIGLGLYIVSQVVAAHRGLVEVTSTKEAGTTFRVRLERNVLMGEGECATEASRRAG